MDRNESAADIIGCSHERGSIWKLYCKDLKIFSLIWILGIMTTLLPAPSSISFIVISVGSIVLSITIATLFVSNNPTGLSFSITGYFKQPSLDPINGNRTKAVGSPDIPEERKIVDKEDKVSSWAEVPALAPTLSADVKNSNGSVSENGPDINEPEVFSSVYVGAEVPAFASTFSIDEMPPTSFVDESTEAGKGNYSNVKKGQDSTEPDVSVTAVSGGDSGEVSSEIIGDNAATLNQTVLVASPPFKDDETSKLRSCDLYRGKWIYDPLGPLYTNNTCPILAQPQNCQGNGRPDKNYENWRWKPYECDIPRFDARKFLELMRGKTLAFVGDSLARNQMDSLLCILWQYEVPINHGNHQMQKWYFQSTSTTLIRIWSAWLVQKTDRPLPSASPRAVNVHLDTPDSNFIDFLPKFDVIVLSFGHWFTAESTYFANNAVVKLKPRKRTKKSRKKRIQRIQKTDLVKFYSMALQTTLNAIANVPNYTGLTILRSYSPEHYEGGSWNSGGSCAGWDRPSSKPVRSGYAEAMQKQQVAEIGMAGKELRNGSKLRLMDITEMSGYRHDAHASLYSRKERAKNVPEDCVHWCMPGTTDTWNEILFELLRREL